MKTKSMLLALALLFSIIIMGCMGQPAEQTTNDTTTNMTTANATNETSKGLGSTLLTKENPIEGKVVTDVNVFKNETNPLKDVYKNPFGE